MTAQLEFPELGTPARLARLQGTDLFSPTREPSLDRLARLASRLLGAPVALVSLLDDRRQVLKGVVGLGEPLATQREVPVSLSLCRYAVASGEPLVIDDTRMHPLARDRVDLPELGVIAYAGVPLITSDHQALGAMCVIEPTPRAWTPDDVKMLQELAASVVTEIELRATIRELRDAQASLARSEEHYRTLVHNLPNGAVLLFDRDMRYQLAAGEQLFRAVSFSPHDIVGRSAAEIVAPENWPAVQACYGAVLGGEVRDLEVTRDGRSFAMHVVPVRDGAGEVIAGMSLVYDVTTYKQTEQALREQTLVFQSVLKSIGDGVIVMTPDRRFLVVNPEAKRIFGPWIGESLPHDWAVQYATLLPDGVTPFPSDQGPLTRSVQGEASDGVEMMVRSASHPEGLYVSVTARPVRDELGNVTAGVAVIHDLTKRKRIEQLLEEQSQELRSLSLRDELTGLYNRRGFLELGRQQVKLADRNKRNLAMFFLDLNGMKTINDDLGHEQGDRALMDTGQVLKSLFRDSDIVARLGGDEFVVLALDTSPEHIEILRIRILEGVEKFSRQMERPYLLSLSVGVAVYHAGDHGGLEELLARADALMYEQKRARRNASPAAKA